MTNEEFEEIFGNVPFETIEKIQKYIQENYISREEIEKALEVCEKVYEEEMKPYQREELIKEYVHQEIVHYTETIEDYEDDDKKENKHYIEELKEEREHWKDIEKILQNKKKEELYMNWWKYGLYE